MTRVLDTSLSLLIPGLIIFHLVVAPYTKVEESFNIQATHDVLVYGTPTQDIHKRLANSYDHFDFPGAVPRTFIGPVLLAGLIQPLVALLGFEHAQTLARAVLGLFNAFAILRFKANLGRAYGSSVARWYALFQASQFHVIFYASRTLPNMFAFGLTTLAYACLVPAPTSKRALPRQRLAISLFVCAAIIFRSEVAILLATNALYLLIAPMMPLQKIIPPFVISVIAALLISVPVDSYFWQKPLWPELWGFYYNVVLGSSSNWGVSPWHWYFTSALPRLLMNPMVFVSLAVALRQPATRKGGARLLVYPNVLYVVIYCLQPHKETRFIFYVVPPLTAAAALGANFIFTRRSKNAMYALCSVALVLSIPASLVGSTAMLLISSLNYPGGEALAYLRAYVAVDDATRATAGGAATEVSSSGQMVPVHADVLACMTGVTLFGTTTGAAAGIGALPSLHAPSHPGAQTGSGGDMAAEHGRGVLVALDKTEDRIKLRDPRFWHLFDYVIVEDPQKVVGAKWDEIGIVEGYAGIEVLRPGSVTPTDKSVRGPVVGRGKLVNDIRDRIRGLTGGWWVGPRMQPRLHILKRIKAAKPIKSVAS
ncbi:hypothetical protein MCOR25_003331 [Pyricularia grisea]|uniref:Mannosyltransferase n=1 Tax=Pyricularia grisea TaxID=148305 RepID=A0A6P8B5Y3_PYRGI|nr:hypothetical protein PgNI_06318 [Pyricularia grisea]KAI6373944.1 hypothetical protein MCOR25_003331 [Pyricularia grisea]TLD10756.1 hypothetical protein PgNI_06318 [Pyricularia grisea]